MRNPLNFLADRWDIYALQPDLYVCPLPETTTPTVNRVLAAMPKSGTVIDLGCGPGRIAVPVADSRPALQVIGIDVSPRMLTSATYHPRVRFVLGDGEHVTGPPADGAWSVLLFQYLSFATAAGYLYDLAHHLTPDAPLLIQFVAGDRHHDLDHRYQPSELVGLTEASGFIDVTATPGVAPDWWWLTARRPK